MTRRDALKSLTAAALAAVAPIPVLGAAEMGVIDLPAEKAKFEFRGGTGCDYVPLDPCQCCCGDNFDPALLTVSFSGDPKTYHLTRQPDGSYKWTGTTEVVTITGIDGDFAPLIP